MRWKDIKYYEVAPCACNQEKIKKYCYGRQNEDYVFLKESEKIDIDCPSCARNYSVQLLKHRNFLLTPENGNPYTEKYYLVPKELKIPNVIYKQADLEFYNSFEEFIVLYYTKSEIQEFIKSLQVAKVYHTKPQSPYAKVILEAYNDYYHSKDYNQIIDALKKILKEYDTFKWNVSEFKKFRDKEAEIIKTNEAEIKKVINKSYELKFVYAGKIKDS